MTSKKQLESILERSGISRDAAQSKPRPKWFIRQERARKAIPARLIAYDLETTRIKPGTPRPLYITAYSEQPSIRVASKIDGMVHLRDILLDQFLTYDLAGCKFVAWNGNRFDGYIIAAALLASEDYVIRPYLTRSKVLRGLRVQMIDKPQGWPEGKAPPSWEFLDGISMLGLPGVSLAKFLDNFAPDFRKLKEAIDFDIEDFDASKQSHREYAMRDSVGLWHGMNRAQQIFLDNFNQPLGVTMGGACIKIFQANIPKDAQIIPLRPDVDTIIREWVMRGGYCHCVKPYRGPIWKYDINQAYAAAMREIRLPCGYAVYSADGVHPKAEVYIARISARNENNIVPFYFRVENNGRMFSACESKEISDTWLTSIEIEQLRAEGWNITVFESWRFSATFSMTEYVDKLEQLRMSCKGGPSGPIGTMVKAAGNNSYGKTVEVLEPIEFAISANCPVAPPGYVPFYPEGSDNPLEHVFCRFVPVEEQKAKVYHHPHIGAFITAYVRMQVRRAAILDSAAWLYADTDCVVFSRDMSAMLDIDPKRYGAWKIEDSGAEYQIIGKKVYVEMSDDVPFEKRKKSAKGLHVRRISTDEWNQWSLGIPPSQNQVQLVKFDSVMSGQNMYRAQTRRGTSVKFC